MTRVVTVDPCVAVVWWWLPPHAVSDAASAITTITARSMSGRVRICSATIVLAPIQLCRLMTHDRATVVKDDRAWDHPAPS